MVGKTRRREGAQFSRLVCFNEIILWLIIMKMRLKIKNRSRRYSNRTRPSHEHKYTKYKMCLSVMMVMYNKKHLSNIWSWIHEKIKQHLDWFEKKLCLYKKTCKRMIPIFHVQIIICNFFKLKLCLLHYPTSFFMALL